MLVCELRNIIGNTIDMLSMYGYPKVHSHYSSVSTASLLQDYADVIAELNASNDIMHLSDIDMYNLFGGLHNVLIAVTPNSDQQKLFSVYPVNATTINEDNFEDLLNSVIERAGVQRVLVAANAQLRSGNILRRVMEIEDAITLLEDTITYQEEFDLYNTFLYNRELFAANINAYMVRLSPALQQEVKRILGGIL